jgi:hypothetical protein
MKMHLVALAGLASGFAVFSGCANGGFTSTSGQQQNTPVKPHASQGGYPQSDTFVDWRKDARSQKADMYPERSEAEGYGVP